MKLRADEIVRNLTNQNPVVSGDWGPELVFDGVCTDSREDVSNRLFLALQGERFDAHEFVPEVIERGAPGVIVQRERLAGLPQGSDPRLGVPDTLQALQELAQASLRHARPRVVAIAGSNGKTTTKDFCIGALRGLGSVYGTHGSRNNHIGVPLTILERKGDEAFFVAEAGANDYGELDRLGAILEPDVAVITNIGRAHLERFLSYEGVLRAKSEILNHMHADGRVLLNADDPSFPKLQEAAGGAQVTSFGFSSQATYRIESVEPVDLTRQRIVVRGIPCVVPRPGRANAMNAAAALGVVGELGGDLVRAAESLGGSALSAGRASWMRIGDLHVLDDAYNANPDSMTQALDLLAMRPGRRIAVLGDMLELGSTAIPLHEQLGAQVVASGVQHFLGIGPHMAHAVRVAAATGLDTRARHFEKLEDLVEELQGILLSGDAVLVKGSRGCRMERVVAALMAEVG